MIKTKKGDFVELKFTGYYNGNIFDSNIEEDLKSLNKESIPEKTVLVIGEKMVVPGLDEELENKELEKPYDIKVPYQKGFGERKKELVKTIPLKVFTSQKLNPAPGATFVMDNHLARVITISGARVITDFNNPLAGKNLEYKFTITRIISEDNEKVESLFKYHLKTVPKFEIHDKIIRVTGPKEIEQIILSFKDTFKRLLSKELEFQVQKKDEVLSTKSPKPSK